MNIYKRIQELTVEYSSIGIAFSYTGIRESMIDEFNASFVGTKEQYDKEIKKIEAKAKEIYREYVAEREEKCGKVEEKVKEAIFSESPFSSSEINEMIYTEAYNRGHAGGFFEVYYEFRDLAELAYKAVKLKEVEK